MIATLPVSDLQAQIHALPYDEKVEIARFMEQELAVNPDSDADAPEWLREELLRREKLEAEGLETFHPFDEVRERLLNRFQP